MIHGVKRVFHDGELSGVIELNEDTSRKLKTVLRAENGRMLEIMSRTHMAQGEMLIAGKRSVQVRIGEVRELRRPDYSFTVYQCVMKREYMDAVIEKYTELGATRIVPVFSSRSFRDLKQNTYERYNSIAIDAAIQSEQEFIPEIDKAQELMKMKAEHGANILFHERVGKRGMPAFNGRDIAMVIGPEGGFTESETEYLIKSGFDSFTPLDCILKAETAAVVFAGALRISLQ